MLSIPANQHKQYEYHKLTTTNTTHFQSIYYDTVYRASPIRPCARNQSDQHLSELRHYNAYIILNSNALTFKPIKTQARPPPHIAPRVQLYKKNELKHSMFMIHKRVYVLCAYLYLLVIRPFYRCGELYYISNVDRYEALFTGLPNLFYFFLF